MADRLQVFISCSMKRSKKVAAKLQWLLERLVPNADYWTDQNIPGGELWRSVIDQELAGSSYGIAVITPENRERPWLHFEAGALAKGVGETARLVPYLFDIEGDPEVVLVGPMKGFQVRRATKEDTRVLVLEIATAAGGPSPDVVGDTFERFWSDFERVLDKTKLQDPEEPPPPTPSTDELAASVVRELSRLDQKIDVIGDAIANQQPGLLERHLDRVAVSQHLPVLSAEKRYRAEQVMEVLAEDIEFHSSFDTWNLDWIGNHLELDVTSHTGERFSLLLDEDLSNASPNLIAQHLSSRAVATLKALEKQED